MYTNIIMRLALSQIHKWDNLETNQQERREFSDPPVWWAAKNAFFPDSSSGAQHVCNNYMYL